MKVTGRDAIAMSVGGLLVTLGKFGFDKGRAMWKSRKEKKAASTKAAPAEKAAQ